MLGRARFGGLPLALLFGACSQVLGYDDVGFQGSGGVTTGGSAGSDASAGAGGANGGGGAGGALGGAPSGGAAGAALGGAPSGGGPSGGAAGAGGTLPSGGAGGTLPSGGAGGTLPSGGAGGTLPSGGAGGTLPSGGSGGAPSGGTGGVTTGGTGGVTTGGTGGVTTGGTGGVTTGGTGGVTTGGTGGGAAGGTGGGGGSGGSGGSATGGTGGTAGCTGGLVEKTVAASGSPGSSPMYGAVMPSGDTAIAWMSSGNIYVTRVNAAGTKLGADFSVPGLHVHGFTATTDGYALLVARSPDHLVFVKLSTAGAPAAEKILTGGCNHATIGCEWYDYNGTFFADGGRLLFRGSGYTAYFPIYRRWPDNIAHTGDTLRPLDLAGNAQSGGWGWGCSHSLDVRLGLSGTTVGPICLSDCYAQKAILWSDSKVISSEPSGNCAGTSGAALGGFVPVSGGYWLTYASPEGRPNKDIAVAKIDTAGNVSTKVWLTSNGADDDSAHLVAFKGGLLAAWRTGTTRTLQELNVTTGQPVGSPVSVNSAFRAKDDFLSYPNGDAGWVYGSGSNIVLARYSKCP